MELELRQAYSSITNGSSSLRKESERLGIERKKLKELIRESLSEEELEKFNKVLDKMNKRNKHGENSTRNKKGKALLTREYQQKIEQLVARGVMPEDIQAIYNRCQQRTQTMVARDTLAVKLLALLDYFNTRNDGIEKSEAYISKDDVITMILRNPRIMSSDIEQNIIAKCQVITDKKGSCARANMIIKSNPGIFRKSVKDIREGK